MSINNNYVYELNTYNITDGLSNMNKVKTVLNEHITSITKIETTVTTHQENLNTDGVTSSTSNFSTSIDNFINEFITSSKTRLDGSRSKYSLNLEVNRASSGKIWITGVNDSKYFYRSYQVDNGGDVKTLVTPNCKINSTVSTGEATIVFDDAHGLSTNDIIDINSSNSNETDLSGWEIVNNKRFLIQSVNSNTVNIYLGNIKNESLTMNSSSSTIIINKFNGTNKVVNTGNIAKPKKFCIRKDADNSFVSFYIPGINIYLDDFKCLDIEILTSYSRLDVDTFSNKPEIYLDTYRISPKNRNSSNQSEFPSTLTDINTYYNKFLIQNADSNDNTYDDSDGKNCNQERINLNNKLELFVIIIEDAYLSPYINM